MAPDNRIANQKSRKSIKAWIITRRIIQYASLIVFIVLFVGSRQGGMPFDLTNFPMRLDPLLILSHLLATRELLAGSLLALLTIILTVVFGRAWCGWLCPLGTTLDLFAFKRRHQKPRTDRSAPSPGWRAVKYGLLFAIISTALFGNLTLLFLDPLTILFRTLTIVLWPTLDLVVTGLETALYPLPLLSNAVSAVDSWLRPSILPSEPGYFRNAFIYGAIFVGVILLNRAAERFWCRYLCPLGGLLGLVSKFSLFRREVSEDCRGCGLCEPACPTGTIDPQLEYVSDPAECTMCLECLESCPRSSIAFHPKIAPAKWRSYDPERRQVLSVIGLTLASVAFLRVDAQARRKHNHLIQPPGGRENDLINKCVRCAECMRACPTNGLQPSWQEGGLDGLWTPVLIPRSGYCDYSCNACGQICPVQAIPPLSLADKRSQVIGKAYIYQDRCIAWADHVGCIVCEEMCPIPEKAIYLEEVELIQRDGSVVTIQLPHVERDKCIGCGICEYKCPVNGDAAIRVFAPGEDVAF